MSLNEKLFNVERTDVHDESQFGWPSVITEDLTNKLEKHIHENRRFTKHEASSQGSQSVIYNNVSVMLQYRNIVLGRFQECYQSRKGKAYQLWMW